MAICPPCARGDHRACVAGTVTAGFDGPDPDRCACPCPCERGAAHGPAVTAARDPDGGETWAWVCEACAHGTDAPRASMR